MGRWLTLADGRRRLDATRDPRRPTGCALGWRGLPANVLDMLHSLRRTGNRAAHDAEGSQEEAFSTGIAPPSSKATSPTTSLVTKLAEEGIHWARGEQVLLFDPKTQGLDYIDLEDDVNVEVDAFNKRVVTESFNRVVCRELANSDECQTKSDFSQQSSRTTAGACCPRSKAIQTPGTSRDFWT